MLQLAGRKLTTLSEVQRDDLYFEIQVVQKKNPVRTKACKPNTPQPTHTQVSAQNLAGRILNKNQTKTNNWVNYLC